MERLKKLIEEKAEMRREGLLKQRRPVVKVELEDEGEEAGIAPEMGGGSTPGLKQEIGQEWENLEIKQESGLEQGPKLEIKQERATHDEERVSLEELDQNEPSRSSAVPNVLQDQKVGPKGLLKKPVNKKVKPKLEEDSWEVSPLLPDGWKFHQGSRVFRTSKGDALQSYSKALQHMMVTEEYSDEQMDNLQRFIEEKDADGEEWDSDLEDMEEEHHTDRVKAEKTSDKRKETSSDARKTLTQIAQSETPLKNSVKAETKTQSGKKNISPSLGKGGGNGSGEVTPSRKRRGSSGDFQKY